ncbi:hypothetical protein ABZ400_31555 [Streptomyces sp. NPDC005897]|uniref:hypothetical protein n=1 Tax=Streptomyces sp. NPDC005897 TaxID=3157081 RepID=UPI00341132AA
MTGFAWTEEVLARVDKLVPCNAEEQTKQRGALYEVLNGNVAERRLPAPSRTVACQLPELSLRRYG